MNNGNLLFINNSNWINYNIMEKHEIEYDGMDLTVWGYYSEAEPCIMYFRDGSGQQGYPETFRVEEVYENGCDITEDLSWNELKEIENLILEIR